MEPNAATDTSQARPTLTRLLPTQEVLTADQLAEDLDPFKLVHTDRPTVYANMVSSTDGRAAFHGLSGPLGGTTDKALFAALRARVDAVMAGPGTFIAEQYGAPARKPQTRQQRVALGLSERPIMVTATRTLDLDLLAIPLFNSSDAKIVIFTESVQDLPQTKAAVDVVRTPPGKLNYRFVTEALASQFNVRSLLCEGGPTTLSALLRERLLDELFLTISPRITGGGDEPALTHGPELIELADLNTLSISSDSENFIFLRRGVSYKNPNDAK